MAKKRRSPLGFVKARPILVLGIVLMLVGFAAPTVLAVVHIDTVAPSLAKGWPSGTSSTPTQVKMGSVNLVHCSIMNERPPSVWVEIGGQTHTLPFQSSYSPTYGVTIYQYGKNWTAPNVVQTITFVFKAKDSAGNVASFTVYVHVGAPNGDFYINDQKVTQDSEITLATRTLNFKFVATEDPEYIDRVYIRIQDPYKEFNLAKQTSTTWTGSWTAPADGTYTIYGYFKSGTQLWRGLSIVAGIGEPPLPPFPWEPDAFFWVGVTGIALVGIALVTKH